MTTVAGASDGTDVWLAADSYVNFGEEMVPTCIKGCTVRVDGKRHAVLAASGPAGLLPVLRRSLFLSGELDPPAAAAAMVGEWAHRVASAVTDIALEHGYSGEGGRFTDAGVLLGFGGRLWTLGHHYATWLSDGRGTIGCGADYATGALDVLLDQGVDPAAAVRRAVETAAKYDPHTGGPINVWSTL